MSIEDEQYAEAFLDSLSPQMREILRRPTRRQQKLILDGNATAAGMNRLLDGNDVKDTVK